MVLAGGSRTIKQRMFRAGETADVLLYAVWATLIGYYQAGPPIDPLTVLMGWQGWTALYASLFCYQFGALLHGGLGLRIVGSVLSVAVWSLTGIVYITQIPVVSLLGPTLLTVAVGRLVTTRKLLRLWKDWPL